MPKIFGLRLRDIIFPPSKLKLEVDPVKLPASPTNARGSHVKVRRTTSVKSTKRLSRAAKLLRATSSSPGMDKSEERRRLIEQRTQGLPSFLGMPGDKNHTKNAQSGHAQERPRTVNRKRKALSGLGFGRSETPATSKTTD